MNQKNYIYQAFLLVLLITVSFGVLSFFDTQKTFFSYQLKKIDMFSDIVIDAKAEDKPLIKQALVELEEPLTENCPNDLECIQNFTDNRHPLDSLFRKLQFAKLKKNSVRIAWFGDSFTDADLVVCDLRDTLQSVFGGNGVGFVPITHESAGYRRSVRHVFGGWHTSSILARKGNTNFGINGFLYQPDSANFVKYTTSKQFRHTRKFDVFRLFYSTKSESKARITFNDSIQLASNLLPAQGPSMLTLYNTGSSKVKVNLSNRHRVLVYGASLEDSTGLYIDNYAIKGNSGLSLLAIPNHNLQAFDSLLNYDLIVLQFGLNALTPNNIRYTSYLEGMERVVAKFRKTFGNTPILMISVSDKSERLNGEFVTMKEVKNLVYAQKQFAIRNKLLFWNLYDAMGGENSMPKFVMANPPLASKDYTHMSFAGSRLIGHKLARSILHENTKYIERRNQFVAN